MSLEAHLPPRDFTCASHAPRVRKLVRLHQAYVARFSALAVVVEEAACSGRSRISSYVTCSRSSGCWRGRVARRSSRSWCCAMNLDTFPRPRHVPVHRGSAAGTDVSPRPPAARRAPARSDVRSPLGPVPLAYEPELKWYLRAGQGLRVCECERLGGGTLRELDLPASWEIRPGGPSLCTPRVRKIRSCPDLQGNRAGLREA